MECKSLMVYRKLNTVEPDITATLYSDHLYIAAIFNRSLQDFPYYNLPVYSGHI